MLAKIPTRVSPLINDASCRVTSQKKKKERNEENKQKKIEQIQAICIAVVGLTAIDSCRSCAARKEKKGWLEHVGLIPSKATAEYNTNRELGRLPVSKAGISVCSRRTLTENYIASWAMNRYHSAYMYVLEKGYRGEIPASTAIDKRRANTALIQDEQETSSEH